MYNTSPSFTSNTYRCRRFTTTYYNTPTCALTTDTMTRATALLTAAAALLLAAPALAKTDWEGCVLTTVSLDPGRHYTVRYVEDTGEICEVVDCGGGRAPVKTIPGCPAYSGTETVTPRFWTGWSAAHGPAATTSSTAPPLVEVTTTIAPPALTSTSTSAAGVVETTSVEGAGPAVTTSAEGAGGEGTTVVGGEVVTVTTISTLVETGSGSEPSGSGSDDAVATTLSTAAAVPTGVGKGMLGVVAGVAAAGLVLA